jgi:predicted metal-dependent peptidase
MTQQIPEEVRKKAELHLLEKFALARAWLDTKAIYLADMYEAFIIHFVPGIKTMGVTKGYVLYVDPIWLLSDPDLNGDEGHEYLGADLLHECGHVLRDLERLEAVAEWFMGKGFDKKKAQDWANRAGDVCINNDIIKQGLKMHKWVLTSDTYGSPPGLSMEGVAEWLYKNQKTVEEKDKKGGKGGKGGKDGQGMPGDPDGDPQQQRIGGGCCGGIAGNPNEKLEKELDATVGRDEYDQERIEYETVEAIKEHQEANGVGSTPGFAEQALPKPKKKKDDINWRREAKYLLRRCTGAVVRGGSDYSLRRPSKRSMMLGVIRPGLIDQQPEIEVIVDSSGSMGVEQLNAAKNVVMGVLEQLGIDTVWFSWADTQLYDKPVRVAIKDIPILTAKGRGGTNFVGPLTEAMKRRPRPDLVVYITDGDGKAPKTRPPGLNIVWCIVPTNYGRLPADWGHVILCSNDQKLRAPYGR